jgi:hypothetical protein
VALLSIDRGHTVGFLQPGNDVLRVYDVQGKPYDRVLSVIEDGDPLWVVSRGG